MTILDPFCNCLNKSNAHFITCTLPENLFLFTLFLVVPIFNEICTRVIFSPKTKFFYTVRKVLLSRAQFRKIYILLVTIFSLSYVGLEVANEANSANLG